MSNTVWGDPLWGDGTFVDPTSTGGGTGGGSGAPGAVDLVSGQIATNSASVTTSATSTSLTATFPNPVTAGNAILVIPMYYVNNAGCGANLTSISDSLGNSYSTVFHQSAGFDNGPGTAFAFASAITGGSPTITATFLLAPFSGSPTYDVGFIALEMSGMGSVSALSNDEFSIFGTSGNNPFPRSVTDSLSNGVTVTFNGTAGVGGPGTNTAVAVTDLSASGVDFMVSWVVGQAGTNVPTADHGYTFALIEQYTSATPNISVNVFMPGLPFALGGGGGGSPSIVLNPAQGVAGQTYSIAVTGTSTHFVAGSSGTAVTVSGGGVTVSNVVVTNATDLRFTLALAPGASLGARTVTTQTGAEVPTAVFTVLQATVTAVKRGDIGWSQIRLGLDGTWGSGAYGASTDGSVPPGGIPVMGGLDGMTLVGSGATVSSFDQSTLTVNAAATVYVNGVSASFDATVLVNGA